MKCTQPGCSGSILDGYCDVCGSPPGQAPAPAAGGAAPDPAPGVTAQRPTWSGPAGTSPIGSTVTRGSSRIGSTALGSARAAQSGTTSTRRVVTGSARLRAHRIGAGLTQVPPAPSVDASQAVMRNPEIPENKRACPNCDAAVGRTRDGRPGRAEGFCPRCGNRYSFTPKLHPGDLVAGQYEVAGCLAHGGMGWIYLARDKNVSDRWVVLKGLLNTGDADALAAAISEQQFLAQVEHPLIVEIYNFVTHGGDGYIVMEYVGGRSLKQLLKERMRENGGTYSPLPVDQAIAYILEILPAFGYLHDLGLVYCDFKPDNMVQVGDTLKLIDLGGVRRIDDQESAIYGTVGYQAPEVAAQGATVASDIFTIGRTLLVLCAEFRGYQTTYQFSLPSPDGMPLLADHDSLYRLLLKCCAPDPADRFTSADELRVQLLGLLREEVARGTDGTAGTSAASVLFESPTVSTDTLHWDDLPRLRGDTTDAQYAWLANLDLEDPQARLRVLERAPGNSAEVGLARCRAALEMGEPKLVAQYVNDLLAADPWEWRAVWLSGLAAVQAEDWAAAKSSFNAVYGQVPGELAPKLALALACENGNEPDLATTFYRVCANTDANYVSPAAFGLARIRARAGDLDGATQALALVPSTSRGYPESQRLRAQHLLTLGSTLPHLSQAMESVNAARLPQRDKETMTIQILGRALERINGKGQPSVHIGTWKATPQDLRTGMETSYRSLARMAAEPAERVRLVDRANEVRNWTLT